MPYKSNAQRKFFHAAEARGDISKKVVDEFDKASKGKKLQKERSFKRKEASKGKKLPEKKTAWMGVKKKSGY